MKKLLSLILCLGLVLSLTACAKKEDDAKSSKKKDSSTTETFEIKHTGKKPTTGISHISQFSDGIAIASSAEDDYTLYAINKEGYIIFTTMGSPVEYFTHKNGLISFGDSNYSLMDLKGNSISPSDKGCSEFSLAALDCGYIIGRVKETQTGEDGQPVVTYRTGVMDTQFNWLVEPNAELDSMIYKTYQIDTFTDRAFGAGDYLILNYDGNQAVINLKTGEINPEEKPEVTVTNGSGLLGANFDREKQAITKGAGNVIAKVDFVKGDVWHFYSTEDYMLLSAEHDDGNFYAYGIGAKGEKLFEPIPIGNKNAVLSVYDDYFLIRLLDESQKFIKCYDWQGKLISSKEYTNADAKMSDDIIIVTEYGEYPNSDSVHLYNLNFELIL